MHYFIYIVFFLCVFVCVFFFVGYVCRTKTMHRLLCVKSKFPSHLFLDVTCSCYFWFNLFYVNISYSYFYVVNYSCSLKCI